MSFPYGCPYFLGQPLPVEIQRFFWFQTSPFVKPKFGKHHEVSCLICSACENTHIHNDMKEACKVFEKVLVQNIPLKNDKIYDLISQVPRWHMIQTALPHILHCISSFLQYRKDVMDLQTVSQTESKLLYILHWIILDAAEECADADLENKVYNYSQYYYMFPIASITLFVYLLAPVLHRLKESEFQSFRLENGLKLWRPLWDHRHPDAACFTAYCKLSLQTLLAKNGRARQRSFNDIFLGRKPSSTEDERSFFESPKNSNLDQAHKKPDEKKPSQGESLHKNGDHTVILKLPSLPEADEKPPMVFSGKASILQLMGRSGVNAATRSSLPSEHLQLPPPDSFPHMSARHSITSASSPTTNMLEGMRKIQEPETPMPPPIGAAFNLHGATFMDVAVLRCLFISQWPEEGVFWALNFIHKRLHMMREVSAKDAFRRKRSHSFPRCYKSSESANVAAGVEKCKIHTEERWNGAHTDRETIRDGKLKRKTKVSELRTHPDPKLESSSEKYLEKLKEYEGEHRYCLEDEGVKRTNNSLSRITDMEEEHLFGLIKVASMPSLNHLPDEDLFQKIGEVKEANRLHNPIITVTQHTPNPSPEYTRKQCPSFGTRSAFLNQFPKASVRRARSKCLSRSATDSNISYYSSVEPSVALGCCGYVNDKGDIDISVVLKALHNISQRDKVVCSLRVCDICLKILERLLDMGVLRMVIFEDEGRKMRHSVEKIPGKVEKFADANVLMISCIFKLMKHLGCPNRCGEGQMKVCVANVNEMVELTRLHCRTLLFKLRKSNPSKFDNFINVFVEMYPVTDILDFLHTLLGYCVDPCSMLSPNQKRGTRALDTVQSGYATNFGAGNSCRGSGRGIEMQILGEIFKHFITRLIKPPKDIKMPENMSMYHEVRLLINYVKEAYGGIFRRVLLSGLMDTAIKPNGRESDVQTTRLIRHISQDDQNGGSFIFEDRDSKKTFFKKRNTSSACTSLLDADEEQQRLGSGGGQSPHMYGKKKRPILSSKQSERNMGSEDGKGKFPATGLVNWFRKEYGRSESVESAHHRGSRSESALASALATRMGQIDSSPRTRKLRGQKSTSSSMGHTFHKAKKRVGDQLNRIGFRKGKKKNRSAEESLGSYLSRKNSLETGNHSRDSDFVVLKERRLVSIQPLFDGMQRMAFLMEICHPGSVPDAPLVAAILELPHTPVISRAAFLLECSYHVHCFNKGQWPLWTKLHLPGFRPSCGGGGGGGLPRGSAAPNNMKRAQMLQRTAGKLFYQWAEAIASRLDDMLETDKKRLPQTFVAANDESKQAELLAEDEEEDFLDEATVSQYSPKCPMALRMLACNLLLEITAYLRETFQNLPKQIRTSGRDRVAWDRTNRRFSVALSSMGHSQASALSLQSINWENSERKISFVLHEPDVDSTEDSTSNTGTQDKSEEMKDIPEEKNIGKKAGQGRPYLLRRSTAIGGGAVGSGAAGGSTKMKFKRGGKDKENDREVKRVDSTQSKRYKGSISDRSDTSEFCGSCEDSSMPATTESPDEMPPESPNDVDMDESATNMPWIKVVTKMMNSFNYRCCHQGFCHPLCYRRHMRACGRLMKALRKVYGEESNMASMDNLFDKTLEKELKRHKTFDRTTSDASSKRKESMTKKSDKILEDPLLCSKFSSLEKLNKKMECEKKNQSVMLKYIKFHVRESFHPPLAIMVKSIVILTEEQITEFLPLAWNLLLEPYQEVASCAAALFIVGSFKASATAAKILQNALSSSDSNVRINAILRFQALWKHRYQAWPRMEEKAQTTFKLPPPIIEFTLTSPKIGIESLPVVDPPWSTTNSEIPVNKFPKAEESHRQLSARRMEKTELAASTIPYHPVKRNNEDRESCHVSAIPLVNLAAYEPNMTGHGFGDTDHDDDEEMVEMNDKGGGGGGILVEKDRRNIHVQVLPILFPSSLCSAVVDIIGLLDDASVSPDGNSVYEVAYQVIWNCLVEDSSLFLRYILERLTRDKQELMFKILRHLIRFVPKLPQQAAFTLYNYIIGYVMFYVRSPHDNGQKMIGAALSILWMVVHSVHGIMFKDLKQILRKEQCDTAILLTAHAPSAKKIIVLGLQDGEIPSQFPIQEDTQFSQILRESLDYFGIDENEQEHYYLIDHKTKRIHNVNSYVRDFYCFKRLQYPQLEVVKMHPDEALKALQTQELLHKFIETGKVLLTWAILKNVDMVVQRVVFLHEELIKIGSFPRKALEADLDLYKGGEIGKQLLGLDVLHKFMWVRLIARMFEAMAGNFAYSSDIHLSINVLNGALTLHGQDACILRYVMATYINAAHNFKNIFSTNGYFLIMPTLLQQYSINRSNKLITRCIEYVVKQFYLMNRKPFILQMFGSVSSILDLDDGNQFGYVHKVEASSLFEILLSLETPSPDPLNIGELVKEEKPLKAIDFCYRDENEMVDVVDCIQLCVMVVSYAADSLRSYQMLVILEAILPCYLRQIQLPHYRKEGLSERDIIARLAICVKTLVNNCEALTKHYNGPQSMEHKPSSQRTGKRGQGTGMGEDSVLVEEQNRFRISYDRDEDSERAIRNEYRRPRDVLLSTVVDFVTKCSCRLIELNKRFPIDSKPMELLDLHSYMKLSDVAQCLLKLSAYDSNTMGCKGLQRYMTHLFPATNWKNETTKYCLSTFLRRLDKTFVKIYKKPSIRRNTDWTAAGGLLKGIYEMASRYPFVLHQQPMKSLVNTCLCLITADMTSIGMGENLTASAAVMMAQVPPAHFSSIVIKIVVLQILAFGDSYTLEHICGPNLSSTSQDKVENTLVNFLLQFCLRTGGASKDERCARQQDITYALNVVLATMTSTMSSSKSYANNVPSAKGIVETRTASVTYSSGRVTASLSPSLYKISFLGLKIMTVCFETELSGHWHRIARIVRDLHKIPEARFSFWAFVEFVTVFRNPLYILLTPCLHKKILMPSYSEMEKSLQARVREKLHGFCLSPPICRSTLIMELVAELKMLKLELENNRYDERNMKRRDKFYSSLDVSNQRADLTVRKDSESVPLHRESVSSNQDSVNGHESVCHRGSIKRSGLSSPLSEIPAVNDFEVKPFKSRLHRSKAQSKKTFRFRKSRVDRNPMQSASAPASVSLPSVEAFDPLDGENEPSQGESTFDSIEKSPKNDDCACNFNKFEDENVRGGGKMIPVPCSLYSPHGVESSWEVDSLWSHTTSSTSGYRENCSLLRMRLESPVGDGEEGAVDNVDGREETGFTGSNSTIVPSVSLDSFSETDGEIRSSSHSVLYYNQLSGGDGF